MSDPDPSQEGCGLSVTSSSRCFHPKAEKEGMKVLLFSSLPVLSIFLDASLKFKLSRSPFYLHPPLVKVNLRSRHFM